MSSGYFPETYGGTVSGEDPKLEPGDVVRLQGGGPKMVVERRHRDDVVCWWFAKGAAAPQQQKFSEPCLRKCNAPSESFEAVPVCGECSERWPRVRKVHDWAENVVCPGEDCENKIDVDELHRRWSELE